MNHSTDPTFHIGRNLIGPPGSAYVIAEAGVNHDGDSAVARDLVAAAAEAGADAVKFQVFSAARLVTRTAPSAGYQQEAGQGASQHAMLCRLELAPDVLAELAELARASGIDFLATPFSVPDLENLVALGVEAIKLASTDIDNGPLLDAAAGTGLPVLASTGAAELDEVAAAVARFRRPEAGPLALLHCVSSYPAKENEANLAAIGTLGRTFGCVAGFSDHTASVTTGAYAVAAGARIVEKHLTLDQDRPGPDHAFSLEPEDLADYVRGVRYASTLLGDGQLRVTAAQREVRTVARSSIVAARAIQAGATLSREMLTTKRPGGGISPMAMDRLIGRQTARDIETDVALTWDMLAGEAGEA